MTNLAINSYSSQLDQAFSVSILPPINKSSTLMQEDEIEESPPCLSTSKISITARTVLSPSSLDHLTIASSARLPLSICHIITSYKDNVPEWEKWPILLAENTEPEPRPFIIPPLRICNFAHHVDSNYKIERYKNAFFIAEDEIVDVHPIRFLRNSPFVPEFMMDKDSLLFCLRRFGKDHSMWIEETDVLIKKLHAIAITEDGRHIILQQACKSYMPTCVAMLVLDHGKKPNYNLIKTTSSATDSHAIKWIQEAGLKPKTTQIPSSGNVENLLSCCLSEHGPGILSIDHPIIQGHGVVLDEISVEKNHAKIRDSFHGRSLTLKLDVLLSWLGKRETASYFLQIE